MLSKREWVIDIWTGWAGALAEKPGPGKYGLNRLASLPLWSYRTKTFQERKNAYMKLPKYLPNYPNY